MNEGVFHALAVAFLIPFVLINGEQCKLLKVVCEMIFPLHFRLLVINAAQNTVQRERQLWGKRRTPARLDKRFQAYGKHLADEIGVVRLQMLFEQGKLDLVPCTSAIPDLPSTMVVEFMLEPLLFSAECLVGPAAFLKGANIRLQIHVEVCNPGLL